MKLTEMNLLLFLIIIVGLALLLPSASAANNAYCGGASAPLRVAPGSSFSASIVMYNTGDAAWPAYQWYNLGSQDPQDNNIWGAGRVGVTSNVTPNASVTFTSSFTAPTTPGTYPFSWRMVQEGVEWFGQTCRANITVQYVNDASCLNMTIFGGNSTGNITYLAAGQGASAYTLMANTGTTVWPAWDWYNLGSQSPQDNMNWGLGRVRLTQNVTPGGVAAFQYNITAPATPGYYAFSWRMVQDGREWFGQTCTKTVYVY